jgi:hypothetical protein
MRTLALAALSALAPARAASVPAALAPLGVSLQRPVYGGSPVRLNTSEYQFVIDETIPLVGDVDLVSVDLSYYGIPWSSFLYEQPLPVSWSERLWAAVRGVDSYELPVMLQFPINGNDRRSCPASNASDVPGTTSPGVSNFDGCSQCFDYDIVRNPVASFVRQAFVNYALAVSYAFNTTETLAVINFGIDANRFLEDGCSAEVWASYKEFTQQVYESLKELYPNMALFPSFSLETLMQAQDGMACEKPDWAAKAAPAALAACAKAGYAALAGIPRDAFGWSAFPTGHANWQPWYLTLPLSTLSAAERANQVVASTGALGLPLAVNFANTSNYAPPLQCVTLADGSAAEADAWFAQVLAVTATTPSSHAWLVNFKTARDTLYAGAMACPCDTPVPALQPYCDLLTAYRGACYAARVAPAACEVGIKLYGGMGWRDLFGAPREPLFSALQAARALP